MGTEFSSSISCSNSVPYSQVPYHVPILFHILLPVFFLLQVSFFLLSTTSVVFSPFCLCDPLEDHGGVLFKKTTASFSRNDANSLMWFKGCMQGPCINTYFPYLIVSD